MMHRSLIVPLFFSLSLLPLTASTVRAEPSQTALYGIWEGTLVVQSVGELPLLLRVGEGEEGEPHATLDSPAQGATGIPVLSVTLADDESVVVELPAIGARYVGQLVEGGSVIQGHWQQAGRELPLRLERNKAEADAQPEDESSSSED